MAWNLPETSCINVQQAYSLTCGATNMTINGQLNVALEPSSELVVEGVCYWYKPLGPTTHRIEPFDDFASSNCNIWITHKSPAQSNLSQQCHIVNSIYKQCTLHMHFVVIKEVKEHFRPDERNKQGGSHQLTKRQHNNQLLVKYHLTTTSMCIGGLMYRATPQCIVGLSAICICMNLVQRTLWNNHCSWATPWIGRWWGLWGENDMV